MLPTLIAPPPHPPHPPGPPSSSTIITMHAWVRAYLHQPPHGIRLADLGAHVQHAAGGRGREAAGARGRGEGMEGGQVRRRNSTISLLICWTVRMAEPAVSTCLTCNTRHTHIPCHLPPPPPPGHPAPPPSTPPVPHAPVDGHPPLPGQIQQRQGGAVLQAAAAAAGGCGGQHEASRVGRGCGQMRRLMK